MSSTGMLLRLSGSLRAVLSKRRPLRRDRAPDDPLSQAERLFLRGKALARIGDHEIAKRMFRDAVELVPNFTEALEAEAELFELGGAEEAARINYARVREIRRGECGGAPDRHFVWRQTGSTSGEVYSYNAVLRSLRKFALPHLLRGNAFLASGRAERAFADYMKSIKWQKDKFDGLALVAEAQIAMARYADAIESLDKVLEARPNDASALSARAIARMACGQLEEANADWKKQLTLLTGQPAAAAYVALRMGLYEVAEPLLEGLAKPAGSNPYWSIYFRVARVRMGKPVPSLSNASIDGWPAALLEFQDGKLAGSDLLARADTAGRKAEALFQLAVWSHASDKNAALDRWRQVVEIGSPVLMEHAAARNELARDADR